MSGPIDDLWRIRLPRDHGPIIKDPRAFIYAPEPPEPPPQVGRWWYCPECGAADTYPENESIVICALHSPTPRQPLRLTEFDWLHCKNPQALAELAGHKNGPMPWLSQCQGVPLGAAPELACEMLRCRYGNPFRPFTPDPAWLTWRDGTVKSLVEGCMRYGLAVNAAALPILADALEEAGCTREDVLRHLREPGEHWPGCFVLRAILA